jgi:hypothetical protein
MNRTEAKELLPVITAFANGEDVQWRDYMNGKQDNWISTDSPIFNPGLKWRIAPKPKTCERWGFAIFRLDGSTLAAVFPDTLENAEAAVRIYRKAYPDATFSSIVRVEFVEEKTA